MNRKHSHIEGAFFVPKNARFENCYALYMYRVDTDVSTRVKGLTPSPYPLPQGRGEEF